MAGSVRNETHRGGTENATGRAQRRAKLSLRMLALYPLCLCGSFGFPDPPSQWGNDHVGKPIPEFASGDECLFCHRNDVGPSWGDNHHNRTLRTVEADAPAVAAMKQDPQLQEAAAAITLVFGERRRQRFLKPAAGYGQLELLSTQWSPTHGGTKGRLLDAAEPKWDAKQFGNDCAGCHATAVDPKTRSFAALSLDCYVCHGDVPAKHAKDTVEVYLAKKRNDPARVTTSICAQCHVRTGKSKSSGLPYPNNFVAGDNLFRDFEVDLSEKAIAAQNPADRHVLENVRDVVILGKDAVTCLSCHQVHRQSTKIHHRVRESAACATCHPASGSKKEHKSYEVHSTTCGY